MENRELNRVRYISKLERSNSILKAKLTIMKDKLSTRVRSDMENREWDRQMAIIVGVLDLIETGDEYWMNSYIESI